ncbi:glycosyltransferase family 2 protein [Paenibacillus piri]|uniref:Glycosyltransferase family 2 protein n=1 Tax=Paenibacillus piri TaxID=2547395 RepID=A0A4R5KDZ3_9BACL|nr:glycosyltransferase family A protein [Paenibacillus piri]TDF92340.1 glycosyltransferase family 2 protein [Paenibacillus piri]
MVEQQGGTALKETAWYLEVYEKENPLVTVCIPTYNRSNLLIERSLKSILKQTYLHLEIIVIGDHCTDDTAVRIQALGDSRIRFENLPQRGQYPSEPRQRWLVAGSFPSNRALELASGDFVTHLDDDDEFVPERIEKLVRYAQATKADLVFHPFYHELYPDYWDMNRAEALECNRVTTSSIFYHKWLKGVHWDPGCYLWNEPGDWNRIRRMIVLGIQSVRYPEPLTIHFKEGGNGHV